MPLNTSSTAALSLALTAGAALAGNTIYVGTSNGGVWKTTNMGGSGAPTAPNEFTFGSPGMRPIVGDWNGDGRDTAGVYDPGTGFFFLRNSNAPDQPDVTTLVVNPQGSLPIAGDWNGDGVDTVGLYDPASGTFFLRNANTPQANVFTITFQGSLSGLLPVAGDWDGDGIDTLGLYNPSSGAFFLRNSNTATGGTFTLTFNGQTTGCLPVAADWDGDGITTLGVYDPATGVWYLRNSNTSGPADLQFTFSRGGFPIAGSQADPHPSPCDSVDFNCDGDTGTDADIEAFFACLGGACPSSCPNDADFNNDGDTGTDADIESFFRVLGGGHC